MQRLARSAAALPLLALGLAALPPDGNDEKTFEVGEPVDASITLPDIDGKRHTLGDYRGEPVVIDFWSINCPWSIGYEERLMDLHAKYSEKDVVFLAIDSNKTEMHLDADDPYAGIREYVEKNEIPYPILADHYNIVADRFAAKTTPHVYVLDAKGVLRYAGAIDDDPRGQKGDEATPYVANALDALLAGKEVPVKTSRPMGCTIKRVSKEVQEEAEERMREKTKKGDA